MRVVKMPNFDLGGSILDLESSGVGSSPTAFKGDEVISVDDDELFELVRRNYSEVNKEYIQEQIRVASEYLIALNTT